MSEKRDKKREELFTEYWRENCERLKASAGIVKQVIDGRCPMIMTDNTGKGCTLITDGQTKDVIAMKIMVWYKHQFLFWIRESWKGRMILADNGYGSRNHFAVTGQAKRIPIVSSDCRNICIDGWIVAKDREGYYTGYEIHALTDNLGQGKVTFYRARGYQDMEHIIEKGGFDITIPVDKRTPDPQKVLYDCNKKTVVEYTTASDNPETKKAGKGKKKKSRLNTVAKIVKKILVPLVPVLTAGAALLKAAWPYYKASLKNGNRKMLKK